MIIGLLSRAQKYGILYVVGDPGNYSALSAERKVGTLANFISELARNYKIERPANGVGNPAFCGRLEFVTLLCSDKFGK